MKVIRANSAGFCWGVERAIDIARGLAAEGGENRTVYTDGPLIHNRQMMERMEAEGVREVGDYQSQAQIEVDGENAEDSVIVVRAHGISPERRQYLKGLGLPFHDATCPDVGIIAGKIKNHARQGYDIVIFGDPQHPEVMGLMGYADGKGHVVQTAEDLNRLPNFNNGVCMVSQSTMFSHEYKALHNRLFELYPEAQVFDTICGATKERQSGVENLVQQGAQAIIVIGGRHSANTCKLVKLAESHGKPTFHIETAEELDPAVFQPFQTVGVTAGASTPEFIIESVCNALEAV
jgi:(E)-4-hydroxy-3-methyl-but-2-enyl pyrophosphate reductase